MKKYLVLVAVLMALVGIASIVPTPAFAGTPLVMAVSSYPVTSVDANMTTSTVAGALTATSISFYNESAVAQDITFYNYAGSTATATAAFNAVTLPATIGWYRPFGDMSVYNGISFTDFTVRRSSHTGTVKMYINYSR